jgi:hypothetical protein
MSNLKSFQSTTSSSSSQERSGAAATTTPAEELFQNLELFVSAFSGNLTSTVSLPGFAELESTLIRSLQFFWPKDDFKMTVVLDDTVYSWEEEGGGGPEQMTSMVKSMFRDDYVSGVSVAYNPLSNNTLYGSGWFIQQLIMFWADNFTDAKYIGFVDDDTSVLHIARLRLSSPRGRIFLAH